MNTKKDTNYKIKEGMLKRKGEGHDAIQQFYSHGLKTHTVYRLLIESRFNCPCSWTRKRNHKELKKTECFEIKQFIL